MRAQAARNIFGEVQPITKDEWTKEVTEASKFSWVIAYLWDSAVEECKLMDQIIRAIAQAHKDVKFVSIQSLACIENWPQR
jgi:thioredoxin-like negative regulator of GroEL